MDDTVMDDTDWGRLLLTIARRALESELLGAEPMAVDLHRYPELGEARATFVTLLGPEGALRGCIGSLKAHRPLVEDLRHNAVAAALEDPRFPPLAGAELGETTLEISLLEPPEPFDVDDEADALARLRPGIDGVVFRWGAHRSTFLPKVWESLPEPKDFLAQLKRKAGLAADFWDSRVVLERYGVREWGEVSMGLAVGRLGERPG